MKIQNIIKNLENSLRESEEKLRINQTLKENAHGLQKSLEEAEFKNKVLEEKNHENEEKVKEMENLISSFEAKKQELGNSLIFVDVRWIYIFRDNINKTKRRI